MTSGYNGENIAKFINSWETKEHSKMLVKLVVVV